MATKQMAETYAAKVIEGAIRILDISSPSDKAWGEKISVLLGAKTEKERAKVALLTSGAMNSGNIYSIFTSRYTNWVIRNLPKALGIAAQDPKVRELLTKKPDVSYAKDLFGSGAKSVVIPYSALERYGKDGLKALARSFGVDASPEVLLGSHEPHIINDTLNQSDDLGEGGYLIPEMPTVLWKLS